MKKVDIIVDLQFGSTGKGAIAGYLANKRPYDTVISANRPNAGHTFIDGEGQKMVHKVLPNGVVGQKVRNVLIGAGAIFSVEQLLLEMEQLEKFGYDQFRVHIHHMAVIVNDEHKKKEESYSRIGSTQQGAGTAAIAKMERDPDNWPLASAWLSTHPRVHVVSAQHYQLILEQATLILAEGAQGYSLGIDAGFWPYCTSRNCTVNSFMSDMGIPHNMLRTVIGTARTYPIRVAGSSGPCYDDQKELTWADVGVEEELTTVTQRVRRVFTFSNQQIADAIKANQCDEVFLNFCNYLDVFDYGEIINEINIIMQNNVGVQGGVRYLGHGAAVGEIEDLWDSSPEGIE